MSAPCATEHHTPRFAGCVLHICSDVHCILRGGFGLMQWRALSVRPISTLWKQGLSATRPTLSGAIVALTASVPKLINCDELRTNVAYGESQIVPKVCALVVPITLLSYLCCLARLLVDTPFEPAFKNAPRGGSIDCRLWQHFRRDGL